MIVEFCKYGNLSNYLRSKRDDFIVYKVRYKLHAFDFPQLLLSHHFIEELSSVSTVTVLTTLWKSPNTCQQQLFRLSWYVCAGQRQDGKVVSSGSSCELSELMKRRLESVASTGSSASSGFIEDKSYCDSEEEEEGKGQARFASFQPHSTPPPSLFVPPAAAPPPALTSAPPLLPRNESSPQIVL